MNELKLYNTIDCQINRSSILSRNAIVYEKLILEALDAFDTGSPDRGLMDYIYNDVLNKKIQHAKASVERFGNELFGVLICTLKEMLTDDDIAALKKECVGLYCDGWGEGFEQVDLKIPNSNDILNVSFYAIYGSFFHKQYRMEEIETEEGLRAVLSSTNDIQHYAFQHLDFARLDIDFSSKTFNHCLFLGCNTPQGLLDSIGDGCHVYSSTNLVFNPFINRLYTKDDLFAGYEHGVPISYEQTLDKKIYNHYVVNEKEALNIKETLFRNLHDHSISNAIKDFLEAYDEKKLIAVMGGHDLDRGDVDYIKIARISKKLTELGYLMLSGGGPGAMEATHLGAWMAGKSENDLATCIAILAQAPSYSDDHWLDKAYEVLILFPSSKYESLGIPTWLYGHEPPTLFATKIAKYFANSVREDGLLTIAKGGIIFAPGGAGTMQEIFQEATQNHYLSFGYASPMVFLNTDFWTNNRPIYPLLKKLTDEGKYKNLIISVYDSEKSIVEEIQKFGE